MSKYAAAVYSTEPADWSQSRWISLPRRDAGYRALDAYDGECTIDSFTIRPGKAGEVATVVGRADDTRFVANSSDPGICAELRAGPVAGRKARVEEAENGQNRFWFI
jgi:hypothetical protein